MTAPTIPARAEPTPADQSADRPAEQRGRTTIADRAVERLATCVVHEVGAVYGSARWLRGRPGGRTAERAPARVSARVDGQLVTFSIRLAVSYPSPVREVTRQVRDRVRARVGELTGLSVRQVDIEVTRLVRQRPRRRVE